jgi:hypothetical protein
MDDGGDLLPAGVGIRVVRAPQASIRRVGLGRLPGRRPRRARVTLQGVGQATFGDERRCGNNSCGVDPFIAGTKPDHLPDP